MISLATLLVGLALTGASFTPIGEIDQGDGEGSFISLAEAVRLDVDRSLLVPGDLLRIYQNERVVGGVTVTGLEGGPARGIVTEVSREISLPATVATDWSDDAASRLYQPILHLMARRPAPLRPLAVALFAITDNAGNQTRFGQALQRELSETICRRNRFRCVAPSVVADAVRRQKGKIAAPFTASRLAPLREELHADLLLQGRYLRYDDQIELVVELIERDGGAPPVWWRIVRPLSSLPVERPDEVTDSSFASPLPPR